MSKKISVAVLLALFCGFAVYAASLPLATVTSTENFVLSGSTVPVQGAPNWPVSSGDEIATAKSPATLQLSDGSTVVLGRNSKARIESSGDKVIVRLLAGVTSYQLSTSSRVQLFAGNKAISTLASAQGAFSVDGKAVKQSDIPVTTKAVAPPPPISRY